MSEPGNELVLEAVNLSKTYPDGQVHALAGVSVGIKRGEYMAIMGPSGSGKSTLLHLLGGLDSPSAGEVRFEGQPLPRGAALDRFRSSQIGFVFQSFHLMPTLTALENVQLPMFEGPLGARARARLAAELLEAVNMSHRASHLPGRLSVGERQRVAIARALANSPSVLLADEPTGNLDSHTADEILELFARLRQERRMTVVMVTHSPEVAARAERLIHLRDGQVVKDHS